MINTLITGITGLFSKEYLLPSFLPALWFLVAVAGLGLWVTGWGGPVEQVDSWSAGQKALATMGASIALAVFGYVLQALHPLFRELWSGRITVWPLRFLLWGPLELGRAIQRYRYDKLKRRSQQISNWQRWFESFATEAATVYHTSGPRIPQSEEDELSARVRALGPSTRESSVSALSSDLVAAFKSYDADSLQDIYGRFHRAMFSIHDEKTYSIQTCSAALDREFATEVTIQPTTLGNIIESYNEYSFKRYGMEGEVFWPRLRQVAKGELPPLLDDRKIVLDFALTSASLSLLLTFAAGFGGPWLWHNAALWASAALVGAALTMLFYWLAVIVARQFGELVRTAYDLFRWELLLSLQLKVPTQLALSEERKLWERVSQWIVYGMASSDLMFEVPSRKGAGT
jgi:hypothetical protein